jgi:hypothetical protein
MKFIIGYFKRLDIPTKKQLLEYYPVYLKSHKNPINKILHIIGNFLTIVYVFYIIYLSQISLFFLPLIIFTPFVVYIGAWPGHFKFEKNEPATFKANPVLTKACDWIMIYELITGKLKLDTREK